MILIIIIPIAFVLLAYYSSVIFEIGGSKYYGDPIQSKKDLLWALIPFQMWIKQLIFNIKKLE